MRRLGMAGTTFRRGGQEAIEAFTLPTEDRAEHLRRLHESCGFEESVYLATCNRVEVVFAGSGEIPVAEYRERLFRALAPERAGGREAAARGLHAYAGEGAAEHLFCVASALDSMVPGEAQILGQVKEAYHISCELGLVGPRLRLLFEEAFRAAKRVRSDTGLARRPVSMISLTTGLLEDRLAERGGRLALIGAGDMTRQCAELFAGRPGVELIFVNRSFSGAEALAERFGGTAVALTGFRRDPGGVDAVVTATAAREPILDGPFLRRISERSAPGGPLLLIDLAVPRDVDAEAAAEVGATLYDIDRLEGVAARNRQERQEEVAEARVVLDESLDSLRRRMVDREMAPLVRALHRRYQRTVDEGLERLFGNGEGGLDQEQEERIRRWAGSLVKRFAHIPTLGLKSLAFDRGSEAVESFLEGVRAELGLERLDGGDESRMQAGPPGGEESQT